MCKCNPSIRTPFCGVGDCVWEASQSPAPVARHKYRQVKNYLHNTLGITKDDVEKVIVQTVREVVNSTLTTQRIDSIIQGTVDRLVSNSLGTHRLEQQKSIIRTQVAAEVSKQAGQLILDQLNLGITFRNGADDNGTSTTTQTSRDVSTDNF